MTTPAIGTCWTAVPAHSQALSRLSGLVLLAGGLDVMVGVVDGFSGRHRYPGTDAGVEGAGTYKCTFNVDSSGSLITVGVHTNC